MMNLNRDNYESFFLDYIEGRLSAQERAELEAFLAENPDLAATLEGFEMITLPAPDSKASFDRKDQLKKQAVLCLNEENREDYYIAYLEDRLTADERLAVEADAASQPTYTQLLDTYRKTQLIAGDEASDEHFFLYRKRTLTALTPQLQSAVMVAYLEGWLNAEERSTVEKALSGNAALQKELQAYQRAVVPTETAVFPDKKRLYRKEGRIVPLYWLRYGAGAVAAGLALFFMLNLQGEGEIQHAEQPLHKPVHRSDSLIGIAPEPLVAERETSQPEPLIEQAALKNAVPPHKAAGTPATGPETVPSQAQLAVQEPTIPEPTPEVPTPSRRSDVPPLPGQAITQPQTEDLASNTLSDEKYLTPKEFVTGKIVKSEGPNEAKKSLSPGLGEKISGLFGQKVQVSSETEEDYSTYTVSIGGFEFSRKKQR